ncbi:elongator complex protein 4 isoform X1 [Scyliorhinus canicula]|uniref:elongator complex protein 4 isoform X1 n=2 Tax=Scyliorhinus canicula TaxID=7830 RepID=UPI0018F5921B|nr:elongator complex protein 4 isoform X1 [Scyliorhinus canicula]
MAARAGTSFQRRARGQRATVPGTRPSLRNGQLLLSTGVPSLDYIIGGGLAVGTLLLVEEDRYESYSRMLLKYFVAEGIVCGHSLFIASARDHPEEILQELPAPLLDDVIEIDEAIREIEDNTTITASQNSMTIAWRYQNLPKIQTALTSSSRFGHYYDVSKTMNTELQHSVKCHSFFLPDEAPLDLAASPFGNMNFGYVKLLRSIQRIIREEGFDGACPQTKQRNILRIGIHSLGSLLWGEDIGLSENIEHAYSLTKFLYALRGLLRTSLSACIITVPAYLIQNKAIIGRVVKLSDTVIGLESFNVSESASNPLYKDYHGLLHVRQIPRLNSLICDVPDTKDLAFKLKRKLFTIERLHLPPDLSDTVSRSSKQDLAESAKLLSAGCGSAARGKKHLDF